MTDPLPGLFHDGTSRDTIFFGLQPEQTVLEPICALVDEIRLRHGLTAPSVPPERWHVSLNFVGARGAVSPQRLANVCEAASCIAMRPFVLSFDRIASFQAKAERRPVVLFGDDGMIGARMLHAALHAALTEVAAARGHERAIAPHLTLMRDSRVVPETFIDPIGWTVREFVLIHSLRDRRRHEVLGRWPLVG